MTARRRMMHAVLVWMCLATVAGCSPAGPSTSSSSSHPTASTVVATLPGETVGSATNRVLKDCLLQRFGIVAHDDGGGVSYDMTSATTPTIGYEDIQAICTAAVNAAGLSSFEPRTDEELRTRYAQVLVWHDCIVGQGYDIGPAVSVEEFVAARGSLIWFPGFDAATYGIGVAALESLDAACPQP